MARYAPDAMPPPTQTDTFATQTQNWDKLAFHKVSLFFQTKNFSPLDISPDFLVRYFSVGDLLLFEK